MSNYRKYLEQPLDPSPPCFQFTSTFGSAQLYELPSSVSPILFKEASENVLGQFSGSEPRVVGQQG